MWSIKSFKEVYKRFQSSGLSVKDICHNDVFEIVYPNGVKLRVPVGADLTPLRTLILSHVQH